MESTAKAIIFFIQILSPPLRIPQIPQDWAMIDKFGFLERLCSIWILQKVLNRLVDEGMQHWSNVVPLDVAVPTIAEIIFWQSIINKVWLDQCRLDSCGPDSCGFCTVCFGYTLVDCCIQVTCS